MAVTSTVIWHEPLAGITPALSLMPTAPAARVPLSLLVKVPTQVLVVFKGDATVNAPPAGVDTGKMSANAAPVTSKADVLLSMMVSVDFAPGAMAEGEKVLAMVGAITTSRLEDIPAAVSPLLSALILLRLFV